MKVKDDQVAIIGREFCFEIFIYLFLLFMKNIDENLVKSCFENSLIGGIVCVDVEIMIV